MKEPLTEEVPAAEIARTISDGIGGEDVFPDPMAAAFHEQWKKDHRAVER